jgi:hypothetical protein
VSQLLHAVVYQDGEPIDEGKIQKGLEDAFVPTHIGSLSELAEFLDMLRRVTPADEIRNKKGKLINKHWANSWQFQAPFYFGVLDIDEGEQSPGYYRERLKSLGVAFLWYETFSSVGVGVTDKEPTHRYRAFVEFEKPTKDLQAWAAWVIAHLGVNVDPVAWKPKQGWWGPMSIHEGKPDISFSGGGKVTLPVLEGRGIKCARELERLAYGLKEAKKGTRHGRIVEKYNELAIHMENIGLDPKLLQAALGPDLTAIYQADGGCETPVEEIFERQESTRETKGEVQKEKAKNTTPAEVAKEFMAYAQDRLVYVTEAGCWARFTPSGWETPAKLTWDQEFGGWLRDNAGDIGAGYMLSQPRQWDAVDRLVRSEQTMSCSASDFDKFDTHRLRLLFSDGVWDAATGTVTPLQPIPRWTVATCIPAPAPRAAPAGVFSHFVRELMSGSDEDTEAVLDALAALMSGTRPHKYLVLFGTGRNGKSLLMELLTQAFGAIVFPISEKNAQPNSPGYALAKVGRARLLYLKEARGVDPAIFRAWTGEQTIEARQIFQEEQSIAAKFGLVVATNKRLPLSSISADMDRARVVEFSERFEDDPDFRNHLLNTPELLEDVRAEICHRLHARQGAFPKKWPAAWEEEKVRWASFQSNSAHLEAARRVFDVGPELSVRDGEAAFAMRDLVKGITDEQVWDAITALLGKDPDFKRRIYYGIGLKKEMARKFGAFKRSTSAN